jgi:lipopolysaccharide heptosyltransferase I
LADRPRPAFPLKILILKPSSLGDVIHGLPVLRLLKKQFPQSQIYWWIDTALAPLLERDPDLAGLVPFERRRWARPANWRGLWRTIRWMRAQRFDWVIDLQCLARSGTLAWLANGNLTIGLDSEREGARCYYDQVVRRPAKLVHAVDWNLGVLRLLGVSTNRDYEWLPERKGVAMELRRKWPVAGRRWVALQPGARWLNKRWPAEHFGELVRRLTMEYKQFDFAILGGAEDKASGMKIREAAPDRCLDLTGQLSLPEMVEWLRLSELLVTNDTGPMHVAAALSKPVVALFGPTDPRRTGPYRQLEHTLQLDLPCVPCLKQRCRWHQPMECLRALPAMAAFEAVRKQLAT